MKDYCSMTLYELNNEKSKLGKENAYVCRQIKARSDYLKSITPRGQKWNNDPSLLQMKEERNRLGVEMQEIARVRKSIIMENEIRERKAITELGELDAKERELKDMLDMRAASRRPNGTELRYLYEFDSFRGSKRRLAVLMINEIGLQRFLELRRIANYDDRHQNDAYYGKSLRRE